MRTTLFKKKKKFTIINGDGLDDLDGLLNVITGGKKGPGNMHLF